MNRTSLVHFAVITFVCALSGAPAAAQDTFAESVSQKRAAKAQTSTIVQPSGVFQRTFTWAGNKIDGLDGAKDGLYPQLCCRITSRSAQAQSTRISPRSTTLASALTATRAR